MLALAWFLAWLFRFNQILQVARWFTGVHTRQLFSISRRLRVQTAINNIVSRGAKFQG